MTRLVAEDTSSDTMTFEGEAFPLSTEQASEHFSGEREGAWRTRGAGLEVSGSLRSGVSHANVTCREGFTALWEFLFLGERRKCASLPGEGAWPCADVGWTGPGNASMLRIPAAPGGRPCSPSPEFT